jgi:hypothetical protein
VMNLPSDARITEPRNSKETSATLGANSCPTRKTSPAAGRLGGEARLIISIDAFDG